MAVISTTEPETTPLWKKGGAGLFLIGLAGVIMAYTYYPAKTYSQSQGYFSDDDGATWYADSLDTLPPYKHNGKDAVKAVIYSYAGGSKKFCGYLVRFSEDGKAKLQKLATSKRGDGSTPSLHDLAYNTETGVIPEVKRPLKNEAWVSTTSAEGNQVMRVKAPDGSELDSVLP